MAKKGRTRNWASVVYPDSAPDNWLDVLNELHTPLLISPLHDKDANPDGTPKKPHYHVLFMFDGVKTYEQVEEITKGLLGGSIPVRVESSKGYARYLAHLDNPEKAQYPIAGITAMGGADIAEMLKPTSSTRYMLIREMMEFVHDEHLTEFYQLIEYAAVNRFDDWFPLLCDSSAYIMSSYIKSKRFEQTAPRKPIDPPEPPQDGDNGQEDEETDTDRD